MLSLGSMANVVLISFGNDLLGLLLLSQEPDGAKFSRFQSGTCVPLLDGANVSGTLLVCREARRAIVLSSSKLPRSSGMESGWPSSADLNSRPKSLLEQLLKDFPGCSNADWKILRTP